MFYGWYKGFFSSVILSLYDGHVRGWLQNLKISPLRCDSCLQSFLQHEFYQKTRNLFGWKFLDSAFSSLVLLPLERELSPLGLEYPIENHPWPPSNHRAASLCGLQGERWGMGLGFLTNQPDDLGLQNSISSFSSWPLKAVISLGPSYMSWISQLYFEPYFMRCLLLIPLLRFMVNGLFLSMTFSSMSEKGPLDKSNGTSSESLSVAVTLRSACAVEHRRKTDLSRRAASSGRSLSQWGDTGDGWKASKHQHFSLGVAQGAEKSCLWINLNTSESQSPMQGGCGGRTGRQLYVSQSIWGA